ncbi:hypothetical protein E2R51_12825 [Jeotgalibacillus sp. S-D1]|uniref:hypothetical protein n=1 Tax=Jeotgalibacillus sp. S-D1 TaxID=2552189 RepID=UPI001059329D|nr:hypothetical protein [Jeotgalibacillus sp. S-D1]TDL31253.1 hypothetical protein E2R51_12825 [Jeotgalibacillus sp. S-D1]
MKKGKVLFISVCIFVLLGGSFYLYSAFFNEEDRAESDFSQMTETEQARVLKEVNEFEQTLRVEGGFYDQVADEMESKGYGGYSILGSMYSKEDVRLQIILEKSDVTKKDEEHVQGIFTELMIQNDMDPMVFTIEVKDRKSAEW